MMNFIGVLTNILEQLFTLIFGVILTVVGLFLLVIFVLIPTVFANLTFRVEGDIENLEEQICIDIPDKYESENLFISYAGWEESIEYDLIFDTSQANEVEEQIENSDTCNNSEWESTTQGFSFSNDDEGIIIEAQFLSNEKVLKYKYVAL